MTIGLAKKPKKVLWNCTEIAGATDNVSPEACSLLTSKSLGPDGWRPIEDAEMKTCSA